MTRPSGQSPGTHGIDDLFDGLSQEDAPPPEPVTRRSAMGSVLALLCVMALASGAFVAGFAGALWTPDAEMGVPVIEGAASVLWAAFVGVLCASAAVALVVLVLGVLWLRHRRSAP